MLTTLLDPQAYPVLALIVLDHERWEVEITIDELDTHQRILDRPFVRANWSASFRSGMDC